MLSVTIVIPSQHDIPSKIGRPPLFTSFTISVLNPIAAIAIIIKNFDNSFSGLNIAAGTPIDVATVVMRLAPIKKRIKNGKTFLKDTFSPLSFSAFLALINASARVIGIIANVLVNFTVTALSNV